MTPREAIEPYLEHMHPYDAQELREVYGTLSAGVLYDVNRVQTSVVYGYEALYLIFEPDDFRGGRPSVSLRVLWTPPKRRRMFGDQPKYSIGWTYAESRPIGLSASGAELTSAVNRALDGTWIEASGADLFGEEASRGHSYPIYLADNRAYPFALRDHGQPERGLPISFGYGRTGGLRDLFHLFVVHRRDVRKYAPKFFAENCLKSLAGGTER